MTFLERQIQAKCRAPLNYVTIYFRFQTSQISEQGLFIYNNLYQRTLL
jgi:hypothetical protein